ncbi:MAG: DUF438 domain-containing protein, partial [Candidatus Latescibacterota bacterium]
LHALLEAYPFLLDFLPAYNEKFSLLKNKAMRATMGRMATLSMIAGIGGVPLETLVRDIAAEIRKRTGEDVETEAPAAGKDRAVALSELKEIILDLHRGVEFAEVKARFDRLMGEIDPSEITTMEEQLIRDGMPAEEIQKLCDLHVSVFREALEHQKAPDVPPGHPVYTYLEENKVFGEILCSFDTAVARLAVNPDEQMLRAVRVDLGDAFYRLRRIDTHYLRKEHQLFPFLEKHGVTGPSQVMWGIHDEIRALLKDLDAALQEGDISALEDKGPKVSRAITEMIYKENTILYPMALDTLSEEEWREMRRGEDAIGYAFVTPGSEWPEGGGAGAAGAGAAPEYLTLDTGKLTPDQVNLLLAHLPVEVSFVDENDTVRYYSDTPDRIFPRSPAVIGRTVQNCHPPKSIHVVNRILDAFRAGERDHSEFWIETQGRFLSITYHAVRDRQGTYRGCIEVTQDITRLRGLTGEQRLLDWE